MVFIIFFKTLLIILGSREEPKNVSEIRTQTKKSFIGILGKLENASGTLAPEGTQNRGLEKLGTTLTNLTKLDKSIRI